MTFKKRFYTIYGADLRFCFTLEEKILKNSHTKLTKGQRTQRETVIIYKQDYASLPRARWGQELHPIKGWGWIYFICPNARQI